MVMDKFSYCDLERMMLLQWSTVASQLGGMIVVESYSSTMTGPLIRSLLRDDRSTIGTVAQPWLGPK